MSKGDRGGVIHVLPLLMFVIFAVFWGVYDIKQGLYVALVPSAIVLAALLWKALRPGSEGRS